MTTSKIIFIFIFHIATTLCAQTCPKTQCPGSDIPIHFPFGLKDHLHQRCVYTSSFDLSCNDRTQVIITLPSGKFVVNAFDYESGQLWINDQESCLARRLLVTNLTVDPPFRFQNMDMESYTFLNCTPNVTTEPYVRDMFVPVTCLSGQNYTVGAVSTDDYYSYVKGSDADCSFVSEALVPVRGYEDPVLDGSDVLVTWDLFDCRVCEMENGACGFANETGNDIGCSYPPSYKPNLPYFQNGSSWEIVAVLVPMGLFVIWFMCYCTFKARPQQALTHQLSISLGVTVNNNNNNGLDRTTVESYPKTVLLELSDPTNNTCSICLSEYKLGETVRTIPSCQHYFHVTCIDEWLHKSETCPLCRNIPRADGSSLVNPSLPSMGQP